MNSLRLEAAASSPRHRFNRIDGINWLIQQLGFEKSFYGVHSCIVWSSATTSSFLGCMPNGDD
jgi:hypothetical protein